jgi:pyruvate dehydrogenase E1 component alpha subunit
VTWDRLLAPLLRARRFDEVLVKSAGLITGVFHVSIGVEASAAAVSVVRDHADTIMLGHRNHGHLVALGTDPEIMYREILGRDGGPQRGRAGSLHLCDPGRGVPYTSAMLGGAAALGAGVALAKQRRAETGIVFTFFGDGAMGEGVMYETLNLSAAWRLPLVLVCDNNAADGGPVAHSEVAAAHGAVADTVDGRDPRATVSALAAAAARARSGAGPQFLEVRSEPWPGNATFIPQTSGTVDLAAAAEPAVDRFAAGDPVLAEARALLADGVTMATMLELDERITGSIRSALRAAAEAPPPPEEAALEHVWRAT